MGSITGRRLAVGVALVVAIAGASVGAVVFSGGSGTGESASSRPASGSGRAAASTSSTSSTSTSTTSTSTSTTTTTAPAPVEPAPAPAPAPDPAPAPTPAPVEEPAPAAPVSFCSGGAGGTAGAVLSAMNGARGGGLCWNDQLGSSAQGWAQVMASSNSLYHSSLGGLLSSTAFSTVGENVLSGQVGMSAADMVSAWMGSPDHRANILGPFSAAGVGIAQGSDGQWYVAVQFGG